MYAMLLIPLACAQDSLLFNPKLPELCSHGQWVCETKTPVISNHQHSSIVKVMYHQSMLDHAASLALHGQCVVILALFIGYIRLHMQSGIICTALIRMIVYYFTYPSSNPAKPVIESCPHQELGEIPQQHT